VGAAVAELDRKENLKLFPLYPRKRTSTNYSITWSVRVSGEMVREAEED